ncbi:unnamed protein product [Clonostachys solani]|uniref:Aconitase A/isopropylmalate dehydratase small subunit swivel domain-containing protein n=1 Tax=Clonostachys solani TaxID=160281 RepID=A0A9P0EJM3_9HYPO|nr:unnamed protein product [Clonostachys solani]
MAEVCMENYDAEFRTTAKASDILGSSREQAATSILLKQIPLVVAGSFGKIFSRNSINNALLGVELPAVMTEKGGSSWEQKVGEMPPMQEIIAYGGLEGW